MEIKMKKENADYISRIRNEFQLSYRTARYLSKITPSEDFKEYENNKRILQRLCLSKEEYDRANKCLIELMGI